MPRKRNIPKNCEWCGRSFLANKQTRKFCGKSCSTKSRITPETRERSRQVMLRIIARPEVQEKLQAHLRSSSNPLLNPINKRKAQIVLRELGYPTLTGGNGRGPTIPQRLLAERLGWVMEYPIRTGSRAGIPMCYKVDIAEPILKIAIEVDGHSHKGAKARQLDAKRDAILSGMGWRIIRVQNEQVMKSLPAVIERVMELVKSST